LSEILPSGSLGLGPDEVGQSGLKSSTYDVTHKKIKPKHFFSLQTQRLAESFEDLNSSLAQLAADIFPHKDMGKLLDFSPKA